MTDDLLQTISSIVVWCLGIQQVTVKLSLCMPWRH